VRYREIAAALRARIASGEVGAGELLASEAELVQQFGASRVTVRRALDELREEGLVESRQGYGWYVPVEPLRQSLVRLGTIEEQLAASGRSSERRVTGFRYVEPPAAVAAVLGNGEVLEVRRVQLVDGVPLAHVTVWCPSGLAAELSRADVERSSFLHLLPVEVGGATQTIGADLPTAEEAEVLRIPPGRPVLRARRVTRSADGAAVLYAEQVFPADRTEFVVDLPRSDGSLAATGLRLVG
jgi:GntR family transcriptional regulator